VKRRAARERDGGERRRRGTIYFASFLAAPRLTTIQFAFRPINRAIPGTHADSRILHPLSFAEGAGERSPQISAPATSAPFFPPLACFSIRRPEIDKIALVCCLLFTRGHNRGMPGNAFSHSRHGNARSLDTRSTRVLFVKINNRAYQQAPIAIRSMKYLRASNYYRP